MISEGHIFTPAFINFDYRDVEIAHIGWLPALVGL